MRVESTRSVVAEDGTDDVSGIAVGNALSCMDACSREPFQFPQCGFYRAVMRLDDALIFANQGGNRNRLGWREGEIEKDLPICHFILPAGVVHDGAGGFESLRQSVTSLRMEVIAQAKEFFSSYAVGQPRRSAPFPNHSSRMRSFSP